MNEPERSPLRLMGLWRVPAVIALVLCAIASRLALGAVALPLPETQARLDRLVAAMVLCGPPGSEPARHAPPHHHAAVAFDDQLLLDIAEGAVTLPPWGMALPQPRLLAARTPDGGAWMSAPSPHPRRHRPAPRGPPVRA